MSLVETLDLANVTLGKNADVNREMLERFKAEISFAEELALANPAQQAAWEQLIVQAIETVNTALAADRPLVETVQAAEKLLAPLGAAAKQYTIHCVGHAHIDMDWLWNWPETVAVVNDTFTTVDALMNEFSTFRFSQSQASVYQIMKDYLPELYQRVKERVREGRWEVTASQWVEGDKNLASGEILCRHLLYTRRFFKQEFGLPYDAVRIDWEPDTFGHAHTVPTILNKGGVQRYYFHRAANGPQLFWWQGTDGSRVLAFDDRARGYNCQLNVNMTRGLFEFEAATGLKDYLIVFGVGDHGGGPTRRDLLMGVKMDTWPIFPNIKFSTTEAFYSIAEKKGKNLPVVDAELNYVFEGCYTSQSNIKRANRKSENCLVEAEIAALLSAGLLGMPYPADSLYTGWKQTMFNQFHDILPGSGIHATYEYSQGLFQDILARTSMVKTRSLRAIAAQVNTAVTCPCTVDTGEPGVNVGPGIGGGPGEAASEGAVSKRGVGAVCCDPFVIFNPNPWKRAETVVARIWNRDWETDKIVVKDDEGSIIPAQVVAKTPGWGHDYLDVAFPVTGIDGLGYRAYSIARAAAVEKVNGPVTGNSKGRMENEFFVVEVEQASGALMHLIDKRTGIDLVPAGERLGLLEYMLESPHAMTGWCLGQIVKDVPFREGGTFECALNGPYLATVKTTHKYQQSTFTLTISLMAGTPRIDFSLEMEWLERGGPEIGVPALKVAFPLAVSDSIACYESPNGSVQRSTDPRDFAFTTADLPNVHSWKLDPYSGEVPAQKWGDLTGHLAGTEEPVGITLLNDSKYGYSVKDNVLRLTLIRSSYDPDPLPELGKHTIRFALQPHIGAWTVSDATCAGMVFNFPLNIVGTTQQFGSLPSRKGFAELLDPNVMLSGLKKAEDSDALIVRLYEMEGKATLARMKLDAALAPANAPAVETDVMEIALSKNTAVLKNGVLSVELPAYGQVTVKIG